MHSCDREGVRGIASERVERPDEDQVAVLGGHHVRRYRALGAGQHHGLFADRLGPRAVRQPQREVYNKPA